MSNPGGAPADCRILDFSDTDVLVEVTNDDPLSPPGQIVILELEFDTGGHQFPYSLAVRIERAEGRYLDLVYLHPQPSVTQALRNQILFSREPAPANISDPGALPVGRTESETPSAPSVQEDSSEKGRAPSEQPSQAPPPAEKLPDIADLSPQDGNTYAVGRWFRHCPESGPARELRLSWIGEAQTRFIFLDSTASSVLDLRAKEFAAQLEDQRLTPMDRGHPDPGRDSPDPALERLYAELAYQASHDEITGLVNRKEFERRLQLAAESARSDQATHMLSFISLQGLETVRKKYGYQAANEMLRKIADLLGSNLNDDCTLSRIGVDQFCILHEFCNEACAYQLAGEHVKLIDDFSFPNPHNVPYSVNIDIALVPVIGEKGYAPTVLDEGELACIASERSGQNKIRIFRAEERGYGKPGYAQDWHGRILQALDNNRLALRAQRIQPLHTGRALPHYEILLSVRDDSDLMLPPGEFIEAAENLGLMVEVDQWVVRTVFNWIATHPTRMGAIKMLSINLSGQTISNDRLLEYVFEQMAQNRIPQHKICFEITETTAIANLSDAADFIAEMQNLGCKFSLDDFGTGMASYSYLKQLPVDFLKIDGSLVKEICRDPHDEAMVQSITQVAHIMGKQVVAEFAESRAIIDKLRNLGVDYAQGWAVERPQPIEGLTEL